MKTEDIKGYLIFMVWILWFQRNSLLVETIPNGSAFHKHSSPVLNVQPTFYWNGGLGVLSSMNVCLDCRGSWGLSHQNCQRWDDVSSLWEVAFKGRHLRCEEKQKAWVRILSITHAFKEGNEERALDSVLPARWPVVKLEPALSPCGYRWQVSQNPFPTSVRSRVALCGRGGLEGRRGRSHWLFQETRARWRWGSPKLSWVSRKVCSSVL